MSKLSYLKAENAEYIEEQFRRYLENPDSVDESWQYLFDGIEIGAEGSSEPNGHANGNGATTASAGPVATITALPTTSQTAVNAEAKVGELIQTYRELGIKLANINPLVPAPKSDSLLEIKAFDLTEADLDRKFTAARIIGMPTSASLRDILGTLRETYCGSIGVEFTHIQDKISREWLETRMESSHNKMQLTKAQKLRVLDKLTRAETFERFLHTRYVGQKRFSCEGADALIPMLDCMIDEAGELGATDVVMGMAHRGRLNVLTNIFGKKYEYLFSEFEGTVNLTGARMGEGDVKYHMGYSADYKTMNEKSLHLSLASNPSHLEFVGAVIEGVAHAKQRLKDQDIRASHKQVMPIVIHGDAAFAGQGVCYETIQMSLLRGYATGGTIHIVINNQVGFTTSPRDARSTNYSTDLAKMLETPIFHVNGDDAEAVYYVSKLATQYRQTYHRDVVIDLVCYRKYGHNEGDEPEFTQPLMYKQIKAHPSPREIYAKRLTAEGSLAQADVEGLVNAMNEKLMEAHSKAKASVEPAAVSVFEGAWKGLRRATPEDFKATIKTSVDEKILREIGKKLGSVPADFVPHPKLVRLLEQRSKQVEAGTGIDWGTGEALAYGSLVWEGSHVRLSGQDAERGTFSHRHSVLYDFNSGKTFAPLNHLKEKQASYAVYNSHLSETAVLGFEYGHAIADPKSLTIWEAQFGDFGNGAQVIIDQFISSSESKWQRMCGLVMLLPHGYEGQGPEHSSARLERFLQLCGRDNMFVCNFTTPAQIFHAMRRQIHLEYRKPMVVMSPKSLLRHPMATSNLDEFTKGQFQEVLDDPLLTGNSKKVRKLIFCTGKVYYDLATEVANKKLTDIALVRIEQLYPWPAHRVAPMLEKYASASEVLWVQEEPRNMGAWNYLRDLLAEALGPNQKLKYVGRGIAAAPAVGSAKIHAKEQAAIVEEALK